VLYFVTIAIISIVFDRSETRRPGKPRRGAGGERQGLERRRWRRRRKRKKKRDRRRRRRRSAVAAALFVSSPLGSGRRSSTSGPLETREGSGVALVALGYLILVVQVEVEVETSEREKNGGKKKPMFRSD
jgi:hypothetical protein